MMRAGITMQTYTYRQGTTPLPLILAAEVLHARHQDLTVRLPLFPLMNVAVRAPSTYTPEQYNTDDGRGHSGDMLIRDMGYYPSGWQFA